VTNHFGAWISREEQKILVRIHDESLWFRVLLGNDDNAFLTPEKEIKMNFIPPLIPSQLFHDLCKTSLFL